MRTPIRVVIADDHPLFREGVVRSLQEAGDFDIVGQAGNSDEAIRMVRELGPELVLLDISMPGGGLLAARSIGESAPGVKIVMLTVSEADDDVLAALEAGAKGYVLKGVGSATLAEILSAIIDGESYVPPALAARLLMELRTPPEPTAEEPLSTLTEREEEILRFVSLGLSNKEIARKLDLQEKTVKHHMTRILSKLHVRNRTEAALLHRGVAADRRRSS
jgi:DNA-binding NarL/FixJ family response regulator